MERESRIRAFSDLGRLSGPDMTAVLTEVENLDIVAVALVGAAAGAAAGTQAGAPAGALVGVPTAVDAAVSRCVRLGCSRRVWGWITGKVAAAEGRGVTAEEVRAAREAMVAAARRLDERGAIRTFDDVVPLLEGMVALAERVQREGRRFLAREAQAATDRMLREALFILEDDDEPAAKTEGDLRALVAREQLLLRIKSIGLLGIARGEEPAALRARLERLLAPDDHARLTPTQDSTQGAAQGSEQG